MKEEKAPLLSVNNYGLQLSVGSMEWDDFRFQTIDIFHINKIKNYIKLSKLSELPLPPHRKEVSDFIFLKKRKNNP